MPFNISTFKSNIEEVGYLKTSHYKVIITPPQILLTNTISGNNGESSALQITNDIQFRTQRFSLQGIDIKTANVRRYGVGPIQKYALTSEFNEFTFSVLCDRNSEIWNFWYEWSKIVFNASGNSNTNNPNGINTFSKYYAHFREEYATPTQVELYTQDGELSMTYIFEQSFPVAVSGINLDWKETNQMITLNIAMAYKEHRIENLSTVIRQ